MRGLHDQLPKKRAAADEPAKHPPRIGLQGGLEALAASEYAAAQRELEKASKDEKSKGPALLGLARLALETGKYEDAAKTAAEAARVDKASKIAAAEIEAKAFAATGKLDAAIKACEAVKNEPEARRARLELGALLLRAGKRSEAEAALMTLIDDFNQKRITTKDAEGMMLVGRAAHLLRSRHDANESYNDAERAGNKSPELLLYRADLFLEAYNYGRAEEVVREALKAAPDLAEAHIALAEVLLAQTLDYDAAEKEVQKALAVNPRMVRAAFVRGGIHLRDMELDDADKAIDAGLAIDPTDLDLLSLRAAVRFLADDKAGFQRAIQAVLQLNGQYARLYQIIGEYADWEHRYPEIVAMMKDAVKLDADDGRSFVALGINEIRIGDEKSGVSDLELGFKKDKFNVRAFNTLNLYERDIPADYVDVDVSPTFHVRYPKKEAKILERYLPKFLDDAWKDMTKRYGFTPTTPIGVELYGSREHFSVRTSGLPNVGIQGVCFGKTLATISPNAEPFNWGMVLWHEVGHVFAIQLSKSHVPRWFTEGLSEYETIARRPEWKREEDPALFAALRAGKIPGIESMNRVFTHADDARDVTTAYYASSQISVFLVERFGMPKLVAMLRGWGEGKRTGDVIRSALGIEPAELDRQFRAWLDKRLDRYAKQYVPDLRAPDPDAAAKAVEASPKDAKAHVQLAIAKLVQGDGEAAKKELDQATSLDPKSPDVHFVRAKVALGSRDAKAARSELEAMIAEGHDGYSVRMMLAEVLEASGDKDGVPAQLEAATNLDPSQAEPLRALVDLAHKANDDDRELRFLRPLAMIDQHDKRVWRRLLEKLVARGQWDEAKRVGEGALYVDIHGAPTHAMYAEALFRTGDLDAAIFEAESALLCEPLKTGIATRANVTLAKAWLAKGDKTKARAARDEALRQDPNDEEAKSLAIP